jgi:3D (Asp-Asp-Asp) domain-containing protein
VALRPLDGDAGELMTPLPLPRTQGERLTDVLPQILPSPAERLAEAPPLPRKPAVETRTYAGKQYRYIKTLKLRVTAYAPDPRCTWPYPGTTTASGLSVKTNGGRLVAADTSVIPMYSLVSVPGYAGGGGVPVLDRGQAIKGNRLDVLLPTFEQAKNWGSRMIDVKVYAPIK